ncbi:hypothetical protein AAD018_018410, partial [Aestuariibius insulae]|uniref:TipJ family phage tail tip protein n=1 Tax=Aestuariibius insulae TaxID=2058287 RepID=UPI00345E8105
IGAPANRVERYAPVAYPVGRHLSYPQPAATGYSETREDTVIYHGLFVLGYGPIGVEEPRFGNVPLSDFDDVELEFRFVDEAYTAPHMAGINKVTYRTRSQRMKLYPGNIAEDNEVATFGDPNDITRRTRPETVRATVVLHFPEGLFKSTREGNDRSRRREFYFAYRPVGATTWTDLPLLWVERERRTAFSVEYDIAFPEAGEYDIRTTYSGDSDNDSVYDTAQLIAIRSEREAPLPLNEELAVVAVRIRASKQLSGGLDRLNFVLRQFAPKWTGSGWSGFQPVDHPAWSYAEALAGLSAGEDRIDRSLIDGDSLKAWADQEPDWRCDLLVRGNQRIGQLVSTICAAGRARDTFIGT